MNDQPIDLKAALRANAEQLAIAGETHRLKDEGLNIRTDCPMSFRVAADLQVRLMVNPRVREIALTESDLRQMLGHIGHARRVIAKDKELRAQIAEQRRDSPKTDEAEN